MYEGAELYCIVVLMHDNFTASLTLVRFGFR